MTLDEIKQAIADGHRVWWATLNYEVIKDSIGQYLIWSRFNDNYIGLTWRDGVTVNGEPEQFFIFDPTGIAAREYPTHDQMKEARKWTRQAPTG